MAERLSGGHDEEDSSVPPYGDADATGSTRIVMAEGPLLLEMLVNATRGASDPAQYMSDMPTTNAFSTEELIKIDCDAKFDTVNRNDKEAGSEVGDRGVITMFTWRVLLALL